MDLVIKGSICKIGSEINTDIIIPSRYLVYEKSEDLARYAFEPLGKDFKREIQKHEILVAEHNFGCGSAREQGATAIMALGIKAVVAQSFARIFYRNAINSGLPVIECPEIYSLVKNGDFISIDFEKTKIQFKDQVFPFPPIPQAVFKILEAGGLFDYLRKKFQGGM